MSQQRDELLRALRDALAEARELIAAYHGEPGWAEYQHSPEMKRINTALSRVYDAVQVGAVLAGAADAPNVIRFEHEGETISAIAVVRVARTGTEGNT